MVEMETEKYWRKIKIIEIWGIIYQIKLGFWAISISNDITHCGLTPYMHHEKQLSLCLSAPLEMFE